MIVPTFEDGQLLSRCLRSIAAQTLAPSEIIVIDDGTIERVALDGIAEAIASFPCVRLIRQPNTGPSAARNRGVAEACGHWLIFVDADDELPPDSIARRMALAGGAAVAAVFGGALFVEPDDTRSASAWPPFEGVLPAGRIGHRDGVPGVLWAYMIRRSVYVGAGGLDAGLSIMEDFDLLARLGRAGGRIRGEAAVVCIQHRRPASLARGSALRQMRGALAFLAKARREGYFTSGELLRRYARVPWAGLKVAVRYGAPWLRRW